MWQLVFAKVPVTGGIIDCDEHGLLYGPGDALGLPNDHGEVVKFGGMPCGVCMVIDRGGGPEVFPLCAPKVPTSFTNILYCASWMITLVSVDDTSFVGDTVPILWGH